MPKTVGRRAALSRRVGLSMACGLLLYAAGQGAFLILTADRHDCRELEYGRKLVRLQARLAEKPGRPLVVMLGSSRPAVGFRPSALPPLPGEPIVFNFAQSGSGPIHNYLWLRRLLAQGIRPTCVVLETWPPFWQLYSKGEDVVGPGGFGPFSWDDVQHLRPYAQAPRRLCADWLGAQLSPMHARRGPTQRAFFPRWMPPPPHDVMCMDLIDADGWRRSGDAHNPAAYQHFVKLYAKTFEFLKEFHIPDAAACALRDTLALCHAEGIRPVLLSMPETTDFQALYPPAAQNKVQCFLRSLSAEHQVPLVDARTWQPTTAFSDTVHLHAACATTFTRLFGTEVLRPLLKGEPLRPAPGSPRAEPEIVARTE